MQSNFQNYQLIRRCKASSKAEVIFETKTRKEIIEAKTLLQLNLPDFQKHLYEYQIQKSY